jgi:hypothetical protein
MVNSIYKVFSIYKRIPYIFDESNFNMINTIFDPVGKHWFDNTNKFIKDNCERIYSEIENFYYTYNEVAALMVYQTIIDSNIHLENINNKNMEVFKSIFTKKTLRNDEQMVLSANRSVKLDIQDYFKVCEDGKSIIYDLIKNDVVSIYFFINYYNKVLTNELGNNFFQFKGNKKYISFIHKIKFINDILNISHITIK